MWTKSGTNSNRINDLRDFLRDFFPITEDMQDNARR
jgi:hypothetical protein